MATFLPFASLKDAQNQRLDPRKRRKLRLNGDNVSGARDPLQHRRSGAEKISAAADGDKLRQAGRPPQAGLRSRAGEAMSALRRLADRRNRKRFAIAEQRVLFAGKAGEIARWRSRRPARIRTGGNIGVEADKVEARPRSLRSSFIASSGRISEPYSRPRRGCGGIGPKKWRRRAAQLRPDRGVSRPGQRGGGRAREVARRQAECGEQGVERAVEACAGKSPGARIGAADVRAEGASQAVGIDVVEEAVFSGLSGRDAR